MSVFELGKSNAFGNNKNVSKGNYGTNFWGHKLFKFDGSINDKKNLLQSVKTFVRLLTGKNIPVKYARNFLGGEEDKSYTDGKVVTISSKVDHTSLDSTIGLSLHEGSHIVKTNFSLIKKLIEKEDVPLRFHEYVNYIKNLHNWVEDRRIDNWAFNKKPGYKIYYLELYDRYFYCKEIEQSLEENEEILKLETGRNYDFFIINSLHPSIKMDELKGLPEIKKIIDIHNIELLKSTEDTLNLSYQIMDVILNNIPEAEKIKINNENYSLKGESELSDKDLSDILKKLLKMQHSFSDGDVLDIDGNYIKIKIDKKGYELLEALEKAETELEKIEDEKNGTYEVVTVNHLDETSILSGLYDIFNTTKDSQQESRILTGLKLGSMLGHKLQIREDDKSLKTVRLKSGKIDNRNLFSVGNGNYDIFQNTKSEKYSDIATHISVDMSSSMCGEKWNMTLIALVAIAKATSMIRGIRTQISLRYSGNLITPSSEAGLYSYNDEAIVINFYDSKYDNIKKMELLAYADPSGGTPEGVCFEALSKKIMKPLLNKNTLFINFSDGAPGMHTISSSRGVAITKNAIQKFKGMGIKILSYYIKSSDYTDNFLYSHDSSKKQFMTMYGNEAEFINVQNMVEIAKTINKSFLKMGKN